MCVWVCVGGWVGGSRAHGGSGWAGWWAAGMRARRRRKRRQPCRRLCSRIRSLARCAPSVDCPCAPLVAPRPAPPRKHIARVRTITRTHARPPGACARARKCRRCLARPEAAAAERRPPCVQPRDARLDGLGRGDEGGTWCRQATKMCARAGGGCAQACECVRVRVSMCVEGGGCAGRSCAADSAFGRIGGR